MSYKIELTQGKFAIIDDEDYELVSRYKWHYRTCDGYAATSVGGRKNKKGILMHRLIAKTPNDMRTDHISRDRLDNRKCNIRICTNSQNLGNSIGYSKKTKYKGLDLLPNGKWRARINIGHKSIHLGVRITECDAAKLYDEASIKHFGEFALTNKMIGNL